MSSLNSLSTSWKQHFASLLGNDDGDKNMRAFSVALAAGQTPAEKLKQLIDEVDSIILVANERNEISILHCILNLGGTRSRPENKIVALVGMGAHATCVLLDWEKAVAIVQSSLRLSTAIVRSSLRLSTRLKTVTKPTSLIWKSL